MLAVVEPLRRRPSAGCEQTTHDEGRGREPRPFLGDGSRFSRPDTPALHKACGQPGGPRPGCGCPVAPLRSLFHAGTGFVREALAAPSHPYDMAEVAPRGCARGRSRLLRLCPSGPPAPARAPGRLACPSPSTPAGRCYPVASPHHALAAGGVEGPPALPGAPPVGRDGPTRRVGEAGAPLPTHPPAWLTPEAFAALLEHF